MISARLATQADLDEVGDITRRAYAEYEPILGGHPIPVTEDYAPRIQRNEVWLVVRDTVVAGVMVLESRPEDLMIFNLAVPPEAQHQGVGQWMLRCAEALAGQYLKPMLRLYTNARMDRNIALYRRYGFQETGRRPNPYRPGWVMVDMEKPVQLG